MTGAPRPSDARMNAPGTQAAVLTVQARTVWALQEVLLRLYCDLTDAADLAWRGKLEADEAARLLEEAKRYLGPNVEEVAA